MSSIHSIASEHASESFQMFSDASSNSYDVSHASLHTSSTSTTSTSAGKFPTGSKQFKPISTLPIYHSVYTNIFNEAFVEHFLDKGKESEQFYYVCLKSIIKFFVDLIGYQKFNVIIHKVEDIVNMLQSEKENSELLKTTEYLLNIYPKKSALVSVQNSVYQFIDLFIEKSYEKQCARLLHDVQDFVCDMVRARVYPIMHTGIVIAMKIITSTSRVAAKLSLERSLNSLSLESKDVRSGVVSRRLSCDSAHDLHKRLKMCNATIVHMFSKGFSKICNYEDKRNKLRNMRIQCAEEVCVWLQILPHFFTTKVLKAQQILFNYIETDTDLRVIAAAINSCLELIKCSHFKENITKSVVEEFVQVVAPFCKCSDSAVAVAAMQILTVVVTENLAKIPDDLKYSQFNETSAKDIVYAKACGTFITAQIRRQANDDRLEFVRRYARIVNKLDHAHKMHFLIEATYEDIAELKDWDFTLRLLVRRKSENKLSDAEYDVLFSIVQELAKQTVTGINSVRANRICRSPDLDDVHEVSRHFTLLFLPLHTAYEDGVKKVALCELIKFLDLQFLQDENLYEDIIKRIIKLLFILFSEETAEQNLNTYMDCIIHLGQNMCSFADIIKDQLSQFAKEQIVPHILLLFNRQQVCDKQYFFRLLAIYKKANLNAFFEWNKIFNDWRSEEFANVLTSDTVGNILRLCSYWLRWQSTVIRSEKVRDLNSLTSITAKCKQYIEYCLEIISRCGGAAAEEAECGAARFYTFDGLCRVCMSHEKLYQFFLEEKSDSERNSGRSAWIDDCIVQITRYECLIDFMKDFAFVNCERHEYDSRMRVIQGFIGLIEAEFIPATAYTYLFVYYDTHKTVYYRLYEQLFDGLQKANADSIPFLLISTLINLLKNVPAGNFQQEDLLHLQKVQSLANCFANKVNNNQPVQKAIFQFGIDMIVHGNITLSSFLRYFARQMTPTSRQQMLVYMRLKMSEMRKIDYGTLRTFKPYKKLVEVLKK